jgi:hypothetical protein
MTSFTEMLSSNSGSSITVHRIFSQFLPSDCTVPFAGTAGSNFGIIEQIVYQSNPIVLAGTPPINGWYFSWQTCCRPPDVDNLVNSAGQGLALQSYMFPYTPSNSSQPISAYPCYNSSPEYLIKPEHLHCVDSNASYVGFVADKENDSVYYEWSQPKESGNYPPFKNVIWMPGYNYFSPLPHNSTNITTLNAFTGEVSFKSKTTGKFVTCLKTTEYRSGQRIGEIYRDIPIFIKSCTLDTGQCSSSASSSTYSQIKVSGSQAQDSMMQILYINGGALEVYQRVQTAYAGDSVLFTLNAIDFDVLPNCYREKIRISAYGRFMSEDTMYASTTDCVGGYPCATLQSLNLNGTFVDTVSNKVAFKWYADAALAWYNPVEFLFNIDNNTCPNITSKKVKVLVNLANSIGLQEHEKNITYYPQPFSNSVVFDGFERETSLAVQIFDIAGRLLKQEKAVPVDGKITIQTRQLKQGVYVFVLSWADYSTRIKLIKHE